MDSLKKGPFCLPFHRYIKKNCIVVYVPDTDVRLIISMCEWNGNCKNGPFVHNLPSMRKSMGLMVCTEKIFFFLNCELHKGAKKN